MLARFWTRSRLAQQIRDARALYREVRVSEHRALLRAKRQSVRIAIVNEMRREQIARLVKQRDAALALTAQRLARPAQAGATEKSKSAAAVEAARARVIASAEDALPPGAGGIAGARAVSAALKATVAEADVDVERDPAVRAAQIAAAVARQAGCTAEEVREMLEEARPEDEEVARAVRENVLEAFEGVKAEPNARARRRLK